MVMPPHISKMPSTERDADDLFYALCRCQNCENFRQTNLFGGECNGAEFGKPFPVDFDEGCECFHGKTGLIEHWLNKLIQISNDCAGHNDFFRQLEIHEQRGTAKQFLGL